MGFALEKKGTKYHYHHCEFETGPLLSLGKAKDVFLMIVDQNKYFEIS